MHRFAKGAALVAALTATGCGGDDTSYRAADPAKVDRTLATLVPFTLEYDRSVLTPGERAVLAEMVEAGRLVDRLYLQQNYADNLRMFDGLRAQYDADPSDANRRLVEFFWINKGPYDVFDEFRPWMTGAGAVPSPMYEGRNFYPAGLTKEAFNAWADGLDADAAALAKSDFSAIRRNPDGDLVALPYHEALGDDAAALGRVLARAAAAVGDTSLGRFLNARGDAIANTSDYEASEGMWIDLNGVDDKASGNLDITIGPYENYADELMKRKAAFQLYVGVLRPSKTKQLAFYNAEVHEMDDRLWELYSTYCAEKREVAPGKRLGGTPTRWSKPGAKVTLVAIDLAYSAGYANEQYQTLAFNLPNVAAWQEKFGTKKVMMMNMLDGKFRHILAPIADAVMTADARKDVDQELFSDNTVRHEVAHGIGPSGIVVGGEKTTVRERHQKYYSPFEEAKAEIVSLLFGYHLRNKGLLDEAFVRKMATTYAASTFRTVRFGATSDHARGKVFEFNRLVENGGITVDNGRFGVDHATFETAVEKLAMEIMHLQAVGTADDAKRLLDTVGKPRQALTDALATIDGAGIPVDLRVRYTFGDNWGVIER